MRCLGQGPCRIPSLLRCEASLARWPRLEAGRACHPNQPCRVAAPPRLLPLQHCRSPVRACITCCTALSLRNPPLHCFLAPPDVVQCLDQSRTPVCLNPTLSPRPAIVFSRYDDRYDERAAHRRQPKQHVNACG